MYTLPVRVRTDQGLADQLAGAILAEYGEGIIREALDRSGHVTWPDWYRNADTGKIYRPHNDREALAALDTPRHVLLKGGEGSGKLLDVSTPLPTPWGWTTMGEVRPGDFLLGSHGMPVRVLYVSPVKYSEVCYEVVFDDGQTIVADAGHLWTTLTGRRGAKRTTGKRVGRPGLPQNQAKYGPAVVTTEQIRETLTYRNGMTNHSIPLAAPLVLPEAVLPVDPYVLGAWLGDGTARKSEITVGSDDQAFMCSEFERLGYPLKRLRDRQQFAIRAGGGPAAFTRALKALGVWGKDNKHIPARYLRASYPQRLALFQGLMDTDGNINEGGAAEFCTVSPRLAQDFEDLAVGLGIKTKCRPGTVAYTYKGVTERRPRFRFSFHAYIPVFRMPRKAERVKDAGRFSVQRTQRYIVDVRPHESVPCRCVEVDSPDHLYLAGRGMIPTHNTVCGSVKTLERVRRGMNGVICSPDLQHFKKSLWPEFGRWCPWDCVIGAQRERYTRPEWEPQEAFPIVYLNEAGGFSTLYCGGAKESEMEAWEGPNINFAYGDELKRHRSAVWLKTMSGRVRIPGPQGEPPQIWITTTPRKHWLWEYFGPVLATCPDCEEIEIDTPGGAPWACPFCGKTEGIEVRDDWLPFKQECLTITLSTAENAANLSVDYVDQRRSTLSEKEAMVYLDAAWVDLEGGEKYLQSMTWWDSCLETLPPLGERERLVLAVDAATGRAEAISDTFGIVGVTAHPDPTRGRGRNKDLAVRFVQAWQAKAGQKIDFQGTEADPGPERVLRQLCKRYRVVCVAYDPHQLHDMAMRLQRDRVAWMNEFTQGVRRIEADTDLLRLIQEGHIAHDGNRLLRAHLDNADRDLDTAGKKLRMAKRQDRLHIDLAVCLSMAVHQGRELSI